MGEWKREVIREVGGTERWRGLQYNDIENGKQWRTKEKKDRMKNRIW